MRYRRAADNDALALLLERHSAMVWRVCRQVLCRPQDAEDAYQATFLILLNKGSNIRVSQSAAGWLYRVALRTALAAKRQRTARREQTLGEDPPVAESAFPNLQARQSAAVLMEELQALPDKYRAPLVMRYLEGQSRRAIADQTDSTIAAVQGRLSRGKKMLRARLARRGVSLALAFGLVSQARPADAAPTIFSAEGSVIAPTVAAKLLVSQGARSMLFATYAKPGAALAALSLVAAIAVAQKPSAAPTHAPVIRLASEARGATPPTPQATIRQAQGTQEDNPAGSPQQELQPRASDASQSPPAHAGELGPAEAEAHDDNPQAASGHDQPAAGAGIAAATAGDRDAPDTAAHPATTPQPAELLKRQRELEQDYWRLRAEALEQKAAALRLNRKAEIKNNADRARQRYEAQELAAQAEARLLEADAMQARAKAIEVQLKTLATEQAQRPSVSAPANAYHPTPVYHPAPVYQPTPVYTSVPRYYQPPPAVYQTPRYQPRADGQSPQSVLPSVVGETHAGPPRAQPPQAPNASTFQLPPASYPATNGKHLRFSAVKQLTLSMGRMQFMLDLDTGQTMDLPATLGRPEQQRMDVYPHQSQGHDRPEWLTFKDVRGAVMPPSAWDDNGPIAIGVYFSTENPKTHNPLAAKLEKLLIEDDRWDGPSTCLFETADGTQGILQVMGIEQPEAEGPASVRLRYKTVVTDGEHSVSDANQGGRGADTVASRELLHAGQQLFIRFVDEADPFEGVIDGSFGISYAGEVHLPLLGPVRVAGRSISDATKSIQQALRAYVPKPVGEIKIAPTPALHPTAQRTDSAARTPPESDKLQPHERVVIQVVGALTEFPIADTYAIENSGKVALGPAYGRVEIAGMSLEEAEQAIKRHLSKTLKDPAVQVTRPVELSGTGLASRRHDTSGGAPHQSRAIARGPARSRLATASPATDDPLDAMRERLEEQSKLIAQLQQQLNSAKAATQTPASPPGQQPVPAPNDTHRSVDPFEAEPPAERAIAEEIQPGDTLRLEIVSSPSGMPVLGGDAGGKMSHCVVEPNGAIALGAQWGRVKVSGKSLQQAEKAVLSHLNEQVALLQRSWADLPDEQRRVTQDPAQRWRNIRVQITRPAGEFPGGGAF